MLKKTVLLTMMSCTVVTVALAADAAPPAKPAIAKICTNCHKAEANALYGYLDNIAFKANTMQVKIDDATELITFDEDDIVFVDGEGITRDGAFLKKNSVKKGHEIKVEYVEKQGVRTAVRLIAKPPVKIPADMLMTTAEIEKLVALGPEKGKYFLFDSRPLPRFQEGSMPTAVNLPYPAFDKMVDRLPADKNALLIFYCAGPSCNMSPGSAEKAKKLGYTNIKVYKDGMPAWQEKNYGILSTRFLKEAWIDKNIPHVLLDVRAGKDAAKGFIRGAVSFPARQAAKLVKSLDIRKNAPVMVYDQNGGKDAATVARLLIKGGFTKVLLLDGGFDAWRTAGFAPDSGKLSAKTTYVPKPRPGEINLDEFRKYATELPANVMILDVRNPDETEDGMLKAAINIPTVLIKEKAAQIPKDKLVITHCSTGVRAEMAYHTLRELGYTNVKFLNASITINKDGTYALTKE